MSKMTKTAVSRPDMPPISSWIARFGHLVPARGRVLDLAAGRGRHTRHFLGRGHDVMAADRDVGGLADLAGSPGLIVVETDLESATAWPFAGERFDAVVVCSYLHRPTLPRLAGLLAPGGVLLYDTFAVGQAAFGRPRNPDFLLRPGELWAAFADPLAVVAYEHGIDPGPPPAMRQRLCAVAGDTPVRLRTG